MTNSPIEWCDHTFNPWERCTQVSPGCDNCYAKTRDERFYGDGNWGKDSPRLHHSEAYWRQPASWNRAAVRAGQRRRVFCGSLCDVMEDRRDLDAARERLYRVIEDTPGLDWLLLTKRPQNFRRLLPRHWLERPRPNVWLMTSVESQDYLWRIKELVSVPAAVHGVSLEPLLGPITLGSMAEAIGWAIIGGESGPGARACQLEWMRNLAAECKASKIATFVKQLGAVAHDGLVQLDLKHHKGGDPAEWPEDLRIREFPTVKWNLPVLATELSVCVGSLDRYSDPSDQMLRIDNFLYPYNLSPDDERWVVKAAWDICEERERLEPVMANNEDRITQLDLKEWVFLVWNTDGLYNGHPSGDDLRRLLNRIGAPHGLSVDDALENYEAPQRQTLDAFSLRRKEY